MLVDNKDKATVAEADVRKLARDAKERKLAVAVLVTRDESRSCAMLTASGAGRRRTACGCCARPEHGCPGTWRFCGRCFERMRTEGPDFLQKNAALADEVRRTLVDIDAIEAQLKKAGTAIEKAQALAATYRSRLSGLCDSAAARGKVPTMPGRKNGKASAGNGNWTQERWPASQQQDLI